MPRSEAFIQADVEERFRKLGQFRDAAEPDRAPDKYPEELASFIASLKQEIRRYRVFELSNRQERPPRRAKGYDEALVPAQALLKALRQMPASQRMPIEPLGPIETQLESLIKRGKAQKERWESEKSRSQSKRQSTRLRNDLALGLKSIAVGYLGMDECEAEALAARYMDELGIKCPNPETRREDFKGMFVTPRKNAGPPPQPSEHDAYVELADAELIDLLKGITVGEYDRLTE
jgi:hypothetical protein